MNLDKHQIEMILLHRGSSLLVDHVQVIDENRIIGYKKTKSSDPYFQGHFPNDPIMPGVAIIEALAQTGAILLLQKPQFKGKMSYFAGIDHVRFKRWVRPEDELIMHVTLLQVRKDIGKAKIEAYVDDQLTVSGEILFTIGEKP